MFGRLIFANALALRTAAGQASRVTKNPIAGARRPTRRNALFAFTAGAFGLFTPARAQLSIRTENYRH
jgi:hypothetical protein